MRLKLVLKRILFSFFFTFYGFGFFIHIIYCVTFVHYMFRVIIFTCTNVLFLWRNVYITYACLNKRLKIRFRKRRLGEFKTGNKHAQKNRRVGPSNS